MIGHRGAAALAPENTLAGLEAAITLGADMVEFDVAEGLVVEHPGGIPSDSPPTLDAVLAATQTPRPEESALDGLARRVLRSTLDQLRSRRGRAGR